MYSETPLDDLLKEYSSDREEFNLDTAKTPEPSPDMANRENKPDPDSSSYLGGAADPQGVKTDPAPAPAAQLSDEQKKEIKGKRDFTAKFLAKTTDKTFAFLNALIADTDDVDEWKAPPEDLNDIEKCYYEMCQSYGWSGVPPWVALIFMIGLTYGPPMREAFKVRGINKEVAARAARAEAEKLIEQQRRIQAEKDAEAAKKVKAAGDPQTPESPSNSAPASA